MRRIGSRVVSWVVAVAITVLLSPVSFAAQNGANTVNSAAIIPADGTSGQSLTAGNGVKTGHIQDGAVTVSKLGIVCANGEYLQYVFGSVWVCNVGTAGPAGATGPQGPAGATPHYANVLVVAKSGGDFTDPITALASISDASATNRYLVKIMPGVYDLTGLDKYGRIDYISGTLPLRDYVDIEGSGETNTIITSVPFPANGGVVRGANDCALRKLKIVNATGWSPEHVAYGVMLPDSGIIDISDVVLDIPSADWDHSVTGIHGYGSAYATLNNVKINIPNGYIGYGIVVNFSMKNSEINMKQGMQAINGSYGKIANSMINGLIVASVMKCFGNYNSDFQPVVCP